MSSKKRPEDMNCHRCSEPKRLHTGDELKCQRGPRKWPHSSGPGKGDGCFKPHYRYGKRPGLSFNADQVEFLDTLLTMLLRRADVGILVRSNDYAAIKKIVGSARARGKKQAVAA